MPGELGFLFAGGDGGHDTPLGVAVDNGAQNGARLFGRPDPQGGGGGNETVDKLVVIVGQYHQPGEGRESKSERAPRR